jgi:hypothetical protein
MSDPHIAYPRGTYRRTTCYRQGCDALVPLVPEARLHGVYCRDCQAIVLADAERMTREERCDTES